MVKKSKPSTNKDVIHSKWKDEYTSIFNGKLNSIDENYIVRLGEEIVKWATEDNDALTLTQFFRLKGIPWSTASTWIKRFDRFRSQYYEAMRAIGDRREIGMIKKKYDANAIKPVMHHYSSVWKRSEEWRTSLRNKADESKQQGNVTVVIEKYDAPKDDK